ncbi:MAG: hypothetical protein Q4F24_15525 [Eubacteriales bacterium]|nr:hypothetical protein [Eubacteriales bacterium]
MLKKIYQLSMVTLCILLGGFVVIKANIRDSFLAACLPASGIIVGNTILKIVDNIQNKISQRKNKTK